MSSPKAKNEIKLSSKLKFVNGHKLKHILKKLKIKTKKIISYYIAYNKTE